MPDGAPDRDGTPDGLRIREATPDDAPELVSVYHSAYRENRRLGFPAKAESVTADTIREWIGEQRVFVATVDEPDREGIVGAVRVAETDPDRVQVSRFGVHEDWKGHGIGSRLLDHVEGDAREEGYGVVWLTTPPEHPTLPDWYRKRGYEKTGEWPLEYREYDEIVMKKTLR